MLSASEIKRLLTAHQAELTRWLALDLAPQIELLNAVASGKHDSEDDRENLYDTVSDAHDLVMSMLFANAINENDNVSEKFWSTPEGQVILNVRLWLDCDEMITISEAAQIARGATNDRDLIWINAQIKKGKLDRYTDLNEPNPQRASRVSRQQVERLKNGQA